MRKLGLAVAQAHLRHLNPFPANLGEVLAAYDRVVIPEMNLGQLAMLVRASTWWTPSRTRRSPGLPFKAEELQGVLTDVVKGVPA